MAEAIGLDVVEAHTVGLKAFRPATIFGRGKMDEFATLAAAHGIDVVIIDSAVSPVQQRNLEKHLGSKVIDRTGLILEIFGDRAQTKEGRLQVELAHLTYQRSRLVRSWTHLERQRGGFGFLGGPGESQLEIDRRLLDERVTKIKSELETVVRTRTLHREGRKRVPYPVVALVGYTNAGKSTLFNRLTKASVVAEDMLFATLDPTMREVALPSGRKIILSDTVGFISELPTHLVAAFRATLEEVTGADLLLHVHDCSHPDREAQSQDVLDVLKHLGIEDCEDRMLDVFNKTDLLDADSLNALHNLADRDEHSLPVSAVTGEGCHAILEWIDRTLNASRTAVDVTIPFADGATLAWVYRRGEILERSDEEDGVHLRVRLDGNDLKKLDRKVGSQPVPVG